MELIENPLVTVICICHNQATWVINALNSVLNQTYRQVELLIVDTGSSDQSKALISSWVESETSKARFKVAPVFFLGKVGNCKGFNAAFAKAKGKYVIDLAADDILLPTRITEQVHFFESLPSDTGLIYGNATYIDTNNKLLYTAYDKGGRFYGLQRNGFTWDWNMQRFFICPQSTMFRSEMVSALCGYNEALFYEDFDFYCRLMREWQVQYQPINLTHITVIATSHGNSIKRRSWEFFCSTLTILSEQAQQAKNPYEQGLIIKRLFHSVVEFIKRGR
jgi:glycosyltransferase involved in cell wall biosynthesis